MHGGICINEWLIKENYLRIAAKPPGVVPLHKATIDWQQTKAWGEGGYYSRIFLNVEGREPQGIIPRKDYDAVRDELKEKLEALGDEQGNPIGTRVLKPEEVYPETNGVPPDLIAYLGNLNWRSVGSIGLNTIHTFENDTGPDDANHAEKGIFILCDPGTPADNAHTFRSGLSLYDVAPTVLSILGIPIPPDMEGKVIQ
jgi:predicted AlkP superfamily phosphohydrolase/phosphomutase